MKNVYKSLFCSTLLLSAVAAHADQTDITVTADIDPTVALTQADGSALPDSIKLKYRPESGLESYKTNVKFWTNSTTNPLEVQLGNAPSLTDQAGANPIPLTVTLNGTALTTAKTSLTYASLFHNGNTKGSDILPLAISQTSPTATVVAGQYSGVVSIIVAQGTVPSS